MKKIENKLSKTLQALKKEKKNIISSIVDISQQYNQQAVSADKADNFLESLPIKNLKESLISEYGGKIIFGLQIMKNRSLLRKKILKKQFELDQMNNSIYLAKIDLVLEKIKTTLAS